MPDPVVNGTAATLREACIDACCETLKLDPLPRMCETAQLLADFLATGNEESLYDLPRRDKIEFVFLEPMLDHAKRIMNDSADIRKRFAQIEERLKFL